MELAPQIVVCMFLAACGHESGKELGDGFLHVDTDAWNTWVIHDRQVAVDSNVTHALSVGDYIVGLRVKPERFVSHSENEISDEYGYFLLDKSTGVLIQGLTDTEMRQIFMKNGWDYSKLAVATL